MTKLQPALCLALTLLLSQEGRANCDLDFGYDPDLRIEDCTARIEAATPTNFLLSGYYTNRAEAWSEKGEFDRALRDSEKAVALDPRDTNARTALCLA